MRPPKSDHLKLLEDVDVAYTEDLWDMLRSPDPVVRFALAAGVNTTEEMLDALAVDPFMEVRCSVAGNTRTSVTTLNTLSTDPDPRVLESLAWNPNVTEYVLGQLAIHSHPTVREVAGSFLKVRRITAHGPITVAFQEASWDEDMERLTQLFDMWVADAQFMSHLIASGQVSLLSMGPHFDRDKLIFSLGTQRLLRRRQLAKEL